MSIISELSVNLWSYNKGEKKWNDSQWPQCPSASPSAPTRPTDEQRNHPTTFSLNVRFQQSLDEQMENMFKKTPDKLSLPKIKEDDKLPDTHHVDENDIQLHRKESYPQMLNFLQPMMYTRPKRKRTTSVPVAPILSELDVPQNKITKHNIQNRSETLPQISDSEPDGTQSFVLNMPFPADDDQKVEFYIDEDSSGQPDDSVDTTQNKQDFIPSSSSSASVEALTFQAQSADDPIPSSVDRHKIDENASPSDRPVPSLRASQIRNRQHKESIPESPAEENCNDEQKLPKNSGEYKRSHHKGRKLSKSENPIWRQRIGSELDFNHRIPIIDESDLLQSIDLENIASHRFGEIRGARRYKRIISNAISPKFGNVLKDYIVSHEKKEIDRKPHQVFVQLNELHFDGNYSEWAERARFIKYEEDVEEGTDRWGKPHVASLSFHSLLSLRQCLEKGAMLLDLEETGIHAIYKRVVDALKIKDIIRPSDCKHLLDVLMLHHSHMNDKKQDNKRRNYSYQTLEKNDLSLSMFGNDEEELHSRKSELSFFSSAEDARNQKSILQRIPNDSEAIAVNIGAVDFLESPAVAFVRLARGQKIPSVTEVTIPVRFLFILIGPTDPKASGDMDYHEVGRSISALMINTLRRECFTSNRGIVGALALICCKTFHQIAYKASERKELLSGINQFLDESIVLPPGDWKKKSLLPVLDIQRKNAEIQRRKSVASQLCVVQNQNTPQKEKEDPLKRTGNIFGGLRNEIKTRYPRYLSDLKDGLNFQVLASACFMFFAALSGAITFGGLYGDKTRNMIGVTETLLLNSFCGVLFSLLSGQPTTIIGVTGPVLLYDESLFVLCDRFGIEFLPLRFWISIWIMVIGIVVVACDGSVLVKFFTRFTQEIFAALISLMFIYEAFYKLYMVFVEHPLISDYCFHLHDELNTTGSYETTTMSINETVNVNDVGNSTSVGVGTLGLMYVNSTASSLLSSSVSTSAVTKLINNDVSTAALGHLDGVPMNQPNTALLSTIMMLGTFFIAYYLKQFRNSKFLGRNARRTISDFGMPIAFLIMVLLDIFLKDTYTMKLSVPEGLSNTNSTIRGWIIPPMGLQKPFSIYFIIGSFLAALLLFILIFMETEICQLILCRKKLQKGTGVHLDLLLLCIINLVCGITGGPWLIAATVRSVSHVSSLTVLSRTHAPGETPKVVSVKDQRVSAFAVYFLMGLSVLMAPALRLVPIAVLFGVFLYMGVSSMSGVQFLDRILLFFMPVKHHPDVQYVRKVKTFKMHLYTSLQCLCLIVLWIVKSTEAALAFPFVLILMVPIRSQLCHLFSPQELKALDCIESEPNVEEPEPEFCEEAVTAG
ncbi:Anion exchange protein 2 [Nymphon striatum]|nr:Anion exchange protein 2 [Nymphon striatum]